MNNVYVVSKRLFRKAYNAEPFTEEHIMKVFDDYHKVISYICDAIKGDRKKLDESYDDLANFHKYTPNPDSFEEGLFITSFDYSINEHYEKMSYRFRSYIVE